MTTYQHLTEAIKAIRDNGCTGIIALQTDEFDWNAGREMTEDIEYRIEILTEEEDAMNDAQYSIVDAVGYFATEEEATELMERAAAELEKVVVLEW